MSQHVINHVPTGTTAVNALLRIVMSETIEKSSPVRSEYDRWLSLIGMADPYLSKVTIGIHEVLQAHFLLADFFHKQGEGIGGVGPKDINLLHSALGRQFLQYGGKPRWTDRIEICATLMFGLIKNHPISRCKQENCLFILFATFAKNWVNTNSKRSSL